MLMERTAYGNNAFYNDLSEKLREEINQRIESFGDVVRYRFNLAQENPDPQKYNGKTVYPRQYTLDPARFTIRDKYEDRKGVSKIKTVAIIKELDEKGLPNRFEKIKVYGIDKGILTLNLKHSEEDRAKAFMLELHPKHENGDFADENSYKIFSRIDEARYAKEQREIRTKRVKALVMAQEMSDSDVREFNSAMSWDEAKDIEVIRGEIETFAENEPDTFIQLVNGKDIHYRAVVQTALNKNKIVFDPAEYKFTDNTTKQVIATLSPNANKTEVELFAGWLQSNGEKADKIFKHLKELIK